MSVSTVPQFEVYIRDSWNQPWEKADDIEVMSVEFTVAPTISVANLVRRFGTKIKRGQTEWEKCPRMNLNDFYIQIRKSDDGYGWVPIWTGIIKDDSTFQDGKQSDQTAPRKGIQTLIARHIVYMLYRNAIDYAYVEDPDPSGFPLSIGRFPAFNGSDGRVGHLVPNRTENRSQSMDCYVFGKDEKWSNFDILEYLLKACVPSNKTENGQPVGDGTAPRVVLKNPADSAFTPLKKMYDSHKFDGRTVGAALDTLIPQNRGLGWRAEIITKNNVEMVAISAFTATKDSVSAGEFSIPANSMPIPYAQINPLNIDNEEIRVSSFNGYNKIRMLGAPIRTCFSVSFEDDTLVEGWEESLQNEYVGLDTDDPDADRREDRFNSVFSRFVIPDDWDWTAGNGEGGMHVVKKNAAPSCTSDGVLQGDESDAVWNTQRVFERRLPVLIDPDDENSSEYRQMLVIGKYDPDDNDSAAESTSRFVQLDQMQDPEAGMTSAHITPMPDRMGFIVNTNPRHVLGKGHCNDELDNAFIDYETIIATVSTRTDTRIRVEVDADGGGGKDKDEILSVIIPTAEAWYIVPNTVIGVEQGALVRSEGGWLRDDTETLVALASLAKTWYGPKRHTINFKINEFRYLQPGAMLTDIDLAEEDESVSCLITYVKWDLSSKKPNTVVKTSWFELDLLGIAKAQRVSDLAAKVSAHEAEILNLTNEVANIPARTAPISAAGLILYKAVEGAPEGQVALKRVDIEGNTYGNERVEEEYQG